MKTTFKTLVALLLTVVCSSFANGRTVNPLKDKDSKALISAFVETISLGSDVYHKYLFTEDFTYQNSSNKDQFNKRQYLKYLKQQKGIKFDCSTEFQILDETGKSCVAKSIMKFNTFTRVDYITLNKREDGWKVSKVVTTYP